MRRRRTLRDLRKLMGAKEAAKAHLIAKQKIERVLLGQIRRELGLTQVSVAKTMGVSQSALSQLESQDDMQLSTLRRLVKAMGGELDLVIRFENRSIVIGSRGR